MNTIIFFFYCSLHKSHNNFYFLTDTGRILDISATIWLAINFNIYWELSINTFTQKWHTNQIYICQQKLWLMVWILPLCYHCFFMKSSTNCYQYASHNIPSGRVLSCHEKIYNSKVYQTCGNSFRYYQSMVQGNTLRDHLWSRYML